MYLVRFEENGRIFEKTFEGKGACYHFDNLMQSIDQDEDAIILKVLEEVEDWNAIGELIYATVDTTEDYVAVQ